MAGHDDDTAPVVVFDPLADLFFSVVAIVVLAVIIIVPTVRLNGEAPATEKGPQTIEIDGHQVNPIRATSAGLSFGADGALTVALNSIDDDPRLLAALRRARQADLPLLVLIEPDGDEAAFQLEPVLAREGVASITQVRLDAACRHVRAPARAGGCPLPAKTEARP